MARTEDAPADAPAKTKYRVIVGINYGDKRAEPDTIVDDIPDVSIEWLLADGIIEKV